MSSEIKKNYIYNVVYRLSICILPLVVTPYAARVLGPEQSGLYAFSSTIACYFIMFGKLGLDNYGNRSIAACRDNREERSRVFWSLYTIQVITSVVSIAVFIVLILTVFRNDSIIYWMQLMYVGSILFDVSWFFYGMERFQVTMIRSLISRTLIIIGVFVFVHAREDLWIYTCVMSACFLLEQVQLIPFLFRQIKWIRVDRKDIVPHIVPNLKLFLPLLALSSYHWMDKIMLGIMTTSTAIVAFYTYAENIINLPKGIISALDTVMLPRISNLVATGRTEEGLEKMGDAIRFNTFLSCALCFGIAGVAPVFIPWFFGDQYLPAVVLTMQLSMVMIPMGLAEMIQTQYLIPFNRDGVYIKAVTIGAVTDIILNLLLIPFYGATGAVIGTLLAEVLVCGYQMYDIRDVYKPGKMLKMLLPFMVCGVLEFLVAYMMCRLPLPAILLLPLQILAGGAVYLAACGIYLIGISKEYRSVKDILFNLKA